MTNEKYDQNNYEGEIENTNISKHPQPKKKRGRLAKRAVALALGGILFGSTAAGAFTVVNQATADNTVSTETAVAETEDPTPVLQTASIDGDIAAGDLDVTDVAQAAMPAIVAITNKSVSEIQDYFSQFGYGYQQPQMAETESCGSGVIIGQNDDEILIVTNNHVVEDANSLSVCFVDNEAYEANLKGTDEENDLAVISVPTADISESTLSEIAVINVADSSNLQVGEQVVAIGNALGYGQSVTTGIVSAVDRTIADDEEAEDTVPYIQTDAAINPGNSGGALLNMNGELIGINAAKIASSEVEGMGYAIPTSRAIPIIEELMTQESVSLDEDVPETEDPYEDGDGYYYYYDDGDGSDAYGNYEESPYEYYFSSPYSSFF